METVVFSVNAFNGFYQCSEPGDNSGEYVPVEVAEDLLVACRREYAKLTREMEGRILTQDEQDSLGQLATAIARAEGGVNINQVD